MNIKILIVTIGLFVPYCSLSDDHHHKDKEYNPRNEYRKKYDYSNKEYIRSIEDHRYDPLYNPHSYNSYQRRYFIEHESCYGKFKTPYKQSSEFYQQHLVNPETYKPPMWHSK